MKDSIRRKLEKLDERFEEISRLLSDAGVISKQNQFRELSMEYSRLEALVGRYRRFLALEADAALVAPLHLGVRGHPVGFSRRYFGELAALTGDEGAKDVVRNHSQELRFIETDDPGVARDVDTPADLAR